MTGTSNGRYDGLSALVTGAGSGIGRATAVRLAAEGAAVAVADVDLTAAQHTCRIIGSGIPLSVDVASPASVARLMEESVEALGGLDLVHANAGIPMAGTVEDVELSDWQRALDVNLTGTMLTTQAAIPVLRRRPRSSIVVTSSAAALRARPGMAPYIASKAGIEGLVRALAVDLASIPIRVNCVAPGPTRTSMLMVMRGGADTASTGPERAAGELPLGHIVEPEDVAAAVAFLGSRDARCITGTVLRVDSGRHL